MTSQESLDINLSPQQERAYLYLLENPHIARELSRKLWRNYHPYSQHIPVSAGRADGLVTPSPHLPADSILEHFATEQDFKQARRGL